jgi:hypothetical protein
MPMPPQADQPTNSLCEALLHRGHLPDTDGVIRVPLWTVPNVDGELRRLCKPGARSVELPHGEDHALSDEAWAVLIGPVPSCDDYLGL